MKICNTCNSEREDHEYTKTDHGNPGTISSHKRCKHCDRSRSRIFTVAAKNAGFSGRHGKWFAITRADRAKIISDFMDHLRDNVHPVTDNLDPAYCVANGFKGFGGATVAIIAQPSKPVKLRKPKKSAGPPLKAMPKKASTKIVISDARLDEIRQLHQEELRGKSNEQVGLREGFVYVIRNPAWPGALKIGSAIDYASRLNNYQTCDPHRSYELVFVELFDDRRVAENAVHHLLVEHHIGGEWFDVDEDHVITVIGNVKNAVGFDDALVNKS